MNHSSLPLMDRVDEYRSILVYRWRTVLIVWLFLSAVSLIGVQLIPNTYQASTTILAYPRKIPEKYVAAAVVDDPSDRLTLLQQEILSSTRLQDVMQKYNLYSRLIATAGKDAAVLEMRKQIKIQTSRGASNGPSAFTLTFTSDNPNVVAGVTNELANSFILKNLSNREQQVHGTTSFISDQLDEARTDLQRQEEQLRVFRMGHLGEMPDQVTANLQAIGQLQVQFQSLTDKIAQLEEQKLLIENAPESVPALRTGSTSSPSVLLETQLAEERAHLADLLTHVTSEHPDAVASRLKISELEKQLTSLPKPPAPPAIKRGVDARLQVIDNEKARMVAEQNAIRVRLNAYQAKVDAVPLRQEQLSELTRDYETAKEHYRSLLEKHYSAEMASELEEKQDADRFEVLDLAAPPEKPVSPNRTVLRGAALVVGLIGSILLAFGLEHMDGSIKSEVDVLKILPAELEFAGIISNIAPTVRPKRQRIFEAV